LYYYHAAAGEALLTERMRDAQNCQPVGGRLFVKGRNLALLIFVIVLASWQGKKQMC